MKEIILDISAEGDISIETRGFTGKSCITETQFLKDLLGKELERSLIPVYWEPQDQSVKKYLQLCG